MKTKDMSPTCTLLQWMHVVLYVVWIGDRLGVRDVYAMHYLLNCLGPCYSRFSNINFLFPTKYLLLGLHKSYVKWIQFGHCRFLRLVCNFLRKSCSILLSFSHFKHLQI